MISLVVCNTRLLASIGWMHFLCLALISISFFLQLFFFIAKKWGCRIFNACLLWIPNLKKNLKDKDFIQNAQLLYYVLPFEHEKRLQYLRFWFGPQCWKVLNPYMWRPFTSGQCLDKPYWIWKMSFVNWLCEKCLL